MVVLITRSKTSAVCLTSALVPTLVIVVYGCQDPTQVTLEIKTNVVCADMRGIEIVVATTAHSAETRAALISAGPRFASASTKSCTEGSAPRSIGTLVVTPQSNAGAVVIIGSFGKTPPENCAAPSFASECIVARRRFTFVDNTPVRLPIVLDPSCAGVPCNETSTCVGKTCVDSTVDCNGGTCTEPGVGADGGLIAVDGASPITTPTDGSTTTDGPVTPPSDGSVIDSGGDSGRPPGECPAITTCLDNASTTCPSFSDPMCCYHSPATPATCNNTCPQLSGCCRDSTDCVNGDICCASEPGATPATRITCKPKAACTAGGGVAVCVTQGMSVGCGGSFCDNTPYATDPAYFHCS